jgi:phosphoribosylamine--glycine ligase
MRVMVIGTGGREHALAWRLARSPSVTWLCSAPGNPGMETLGPVFALDPLDPQAVVALASTHAIDLVVVGPEAPLVAGVSDALRAAGIAVFGPDANGARIEASKAFAKQVMAAAGVATAGSVAVTDVTAAYAALDTFGAPYVVKADGLAQGKGVTVTTSLAEARKAVDEALTGQVFGAAGHTLVIEAFLDGPERSVFGVCDGVDVVLLSPAQDYKRAGEGDAGPNTGGMGAFSPVDGFDVADVDYLKDSVFRPVLAELAARGTPFRGLLYAGIVATTDGPKLLEFNARFGDPETQAIMPRFDGDFAALLFAAATGHVTDVPFSWRDDTAVTVALTSAGYPGAYTTGMPITGIDEAQADANVVVFHAGTAWRDDGVLVTNGGRVLNVTATGPSRDEARRRAYAAAEKIRFDGVTYRRDIAG